MEIKSKYNVGEFVYFMCKNKVATAKIVRLDIGVYFDPVINETVTNVAYTIHEQGKFPESSVFKCKEELVKLLMEDVGIGQQDI